MGVTFSYRRLQQSEAQETLDGNPLLLEKWFGPDFEEENEEEESKFDNWFEWLQGSEQYLDIFKSWQAIHFLLTGEVCVQGESKLEGPLKNVVMGGTPTEIETIYGFAHYLTPTEVAEVAAVLGPLTAEIVASRYSAKAFRESSIYPLSERWGNDNWRGIILNYKRLRAFFLSAARENQSMFLAAD